MPRYRITTVETTTYAYWVDAPDVNTAYEEFDPDGSGKELDHEFEVINIEEVEA